MNFTESCKEKVVALLNDGRNAAKELINKFQALPRHIFVPLSLVGMLMLGGLTFSAMCLGYVSPLMAFGAAGWAIQSTWQPSIVPLHVMTLPESSPSQKAVGVNWESVRPLFEKRWDDSRVSLQRRVTELETTLFQMADEQHLRSFATIAISLEGQAQILQGSDAQRQWLADQFRSRGLSLADVSSSVSSTFAQCAVDQQQLNVELLVALGLDIDAPSIDMPLVPEHDAFRRCAYEVGTTIQPIVFRESGEGIARWIASAIGGELAGNAIDQTTEGQSEASRWTKRLAAEVGTGMAIEEAAYRLSDPEGRLAAAIAPLVRNAVRQSLYGENGTASLLSSQYGVAIFAINQLSAEALGLDPQIVHDAFTKYANERWSRK